MPKLVNKSIAFISSIIISALTTNIMLKNFMLCFNSASFEIADPIFGYDISYFIFQKPFIEFMLIYILLLVVGLTIYTVIYYIISFNIFFYGVSREILRNSHFTKQLVSHIIIIVILLASLTYIGIQDMEVNKFLTLKDGTSYSIYGAGFADVTIRLWGYKILTIVMVVSIILAVIIAAAVTVLAVKILLWMIETVKIKYFAIYDFAIGIIACIIGIFEIALK